MKYLSLIGLVLVVGCNTYEMILVEPHGQQCEYDFYSNRTGEHKLIQDTCGMHELGDKLKNSSIK